MTSRKFYKTVISLEVLSEEPIPEEATLETIIEEATSGSYSMDSKPAETTILNGKEVAAALIAQGSDPYFFNITPEGEDHET